MFPRIYKSKKNSGIYEYLVISESVHIKGKGSTTRNIANLGNIKKFRQEDIDSLIDGLIRLFKVEKFALSTDVEISASLEHGNIILWRKLWNLVGLQDAVRNMIKEKEKRIKIDVEKYVEMMVINRCVDPLSKLGATRWIEQTCYKAMKGYGDLPLDVEYFYRSMDYLLSIKDELEKELYKKLQTLFSINVKLTFYDITSTFFYSHSCPISADGYSRDQRPDREQIVIGVVTSCEGYPIKHYVFEGNTKDEKTVIEVVKQLHKEYQIEEMTFVGDRGMITKLNLATIEKEGFDYIMGVKHRQSEVCAMLFADKTLDPINYREYKGLKIQEKIIAIKDFLLWKIAVILNDDGIPANGRPLELLRKLIRPLTNNDDIAYESIKKALADFSTTAKVNIKISSLIRKYRGRHEDSIRMIICLNEDRKAFAKMRREEKVRIFSESLSKLFANMQHNHNQEAIDIEKKMGVIFEGHNRKYKKYFTILREELTQKAEGYILNQKAIGNEEPYDGIFILSTSRQDLAAEKIVDSYKNLKEVEMLFDDLKHFVDVRPVRHWLEVRVRAHVFICILALLLKRIFEINYLKSKTVMHPLEEISKSKLIKYSVKNSEKETRRQTFLKVTNTTPAQMKIFKMVGIKNPMCLENFIW